MGIFRYDDWKFIDIESNLCDIDSIYNEKYQDLEKIKIKLNWLKLLNGDSSGNNLQLAISDVANEMGNLNIKINAIDAILEYVQNYRNEVENYENLIKTHFDDYWGEFYQMCKIRVDDPDYYELGDFVYEHPAVASFVFDFGICIVAAVSIKATGGASTEASTSWAIEEIMKLNKIVRYIYDYSELYFKGVDLTASSISLLNEMNGNYEDSQKYLTIRDYGVQKYLVLSELERNGKDTDMVEDIWNISEIIKSEYQICQYIMNGIDSKDILDIVRESNSFADIQCEDYNSLKSYLEDSSNAQFEKYVNSIKKYSYLQEYEELID